MNFCIWKNKRQKFFILKKSTNQGPLKQIPIEIQNVLSRHFQISFFLASMNGANKAIATEFKAGFVVVVNQINVKSVTISFFRVFFFAFIFNQVDNFYSPRDSNKCQGQGSSKHHGTKAALGKWHVYCGQMVRMVAEEAGMGDPQEGSHFIL